MRYLAVLLTIVMVGCDSPTSVEVVPEGPQTITYRLTMESSAEAEITYISGFDQKSEVVTDSDGQWELSIPYFQGPIGFYTHGRDASLSILIDEVEVERTNFSGLEDHSTLGIIAGLSAYSTTIWKGSTEPVDFKISFNGRDLVSEHPLRTSPFQYRAVGDHEVHLVKGTGNGLLTVSTKDSHGSTFTLFSYAGEYPVDVTFRLKKGSGL